MILFPDQDLGWAGGLVLGVSMTLAAFGWGLVVRSRRQLLVALADRAERAEADQHARVMEARRAERTRIAAEMHDMLAHRLSMLSLHAGAIELRPDTPPEELVTAAGVVRSSAHQALDDLRMVIGVLRDDAPDHLTPLPTAADLDTLLEECWEAGMRIDVAAPRRNEVARERLASLTERELEIAHAIGEGLSNADIATRLYLSIPTVKGHVSAILDKLDAGNRVQVALLVHDATSS